MGTPCIDCGVPGRTILCGPCKAERRTTRSAPIDWRANVA